MHRSQLASPSLAILFLLVSGFSHASDTVIQSIGDAFDLKTNTLLYSETHCGSGDGVVQEVFYRAVDRQLIAHKLLRYGSSATAPSFEQRNYYSREVISVESEPNLISMSVSEMGRADSESGEMVAVKPKASMPVVIDAGFDNFVKNNWDKLQASESQTFQFPLATREILVELRISGKDCSYETATETCFSLEIDNWLLRLLSDPIELGYDTNLRRLSRYRGLSNIGDGAGVGLVVDLRYRYPDTFTIACNSNDVELAQSRVLPDLPPGNAPRNL